jgi:hypothetical protein
MADKIAASAIHIASCCHHRNLKPSTTTTFTADQPSLLRW